MERLRRNIDLEPDPFLVNSAFIYEEAKRAALETICRQYLDKVITPVWVCIDNSEKRRHRVIPSAS
jgi:hypothetical protein